MDTENRTDVLALSRSMRTGCPRSRVSGRRSPRSNALVTQLTANNTTQGRADVLRAVVDNAVFQTKEFNRAFVLMQYFGYLRRNPNDAPDSDFSGYTFWLNRLNTFNGDFRSDPRTS